MDSISHPIARYTGLKMSTLSHISGTQKYFVTWTSGDQAVLDFARLIATDKHLDPLLDLEEFGSAKIGGWGSAIDWDCGVGMGSDQLRHMADEQNSVFRPRLAG